MDIFGPLCTKGASIGAQHGWQGARQGISASVPVIIPAFPQPLTLCAHPGSPRADSLAAWFDTYGLSGLDQDPGHHWEQADSSPVPSLVLSGL